MRILELLHTQIFDEEMNRLRCMCFEGQYPSGNSKDEFDDRSAHVITRVDGRLAGYGRLTPGPNSWFEFRSAGRAVIPTGKDVVDFGRVMVAPQHRGHDHFELILLAGLLWTCDHGFAAVVGSSRPDRRFRPFVHELRFSDSGPVVELRVGNRWAEPEQPVVAWTNHRHSPPLERSPTREPCQPVVAQTVDNNRLFWSARKTALLDRLRQKGFEVIDCSGSAEPVAQEPS